MFDNLSSVVPKNPNSKINFILITNGSLSNGLTMPEVQKLAVVRLGADFRLFWSPHSHEKRFRMRIKWLKSQMFKVIPEPDYLIFMDSDMVIGQSVVPFVDECLRLRKTPYGHSVVSLFTDLGKRIEFCVFLKKSKSDFF